MVANRARLMFIGSSSGGDERDRVATLDRSIGDETVDLRRAVTIESCGPLKGSTVNSE